MNKLLPFVLLLAFPWWATSQNTPCTAVALPNNMSDFQTFSTVGLSNSGVPPSYCGNPINNDIWFSVVAPPSGDVDIATLSGTLFNAAMAFYQGPCNNLTEIACAEDDNCGMTIMPVMQYDNLIPGQTYFIRLWPQGGNGTFEIRITDGDPLAPPLNLQTVGTAIQTGPSCVQLTANTTGQGGCAWETELVDFSQPFTNTVVFNFGGNDGGADGICMVYHNDPDGFNTCGISGGGLAVEGIQNSFIIEFDTWDNGPVSGDIPADHVSVDLNGDLSSPLNGPIGLGNIEDGQDHEVSFSWNPATNNYTISFDGIPFINGNFDIINNVFGGTSSVYCGFTASTGGATNLQTVCTVAPPILPAGSESVVEVEICQGETYFAGGAPQSTTGIYTDFFPLPNGCQNTVTTFLTVNPNSITPLNATICEGECYTLNGINYCNTGSYSQTLPNYLGCDSLINLNLVVLNPEAIIAPPPSINCANQTVVLDGTPSVAGPGMNYTWSGPPGCFLSSPFSPVVQVGCPGTYTLTITHALSGVSCTSQTSTTVNLDVEIIEVEIAEVDSLDCTNSCTTLDASNSTQGQDYTYSWQGPNNFSSSELSPTVCDSGLYVLTISNQSNGCFGLSQVQVSGSQALPIADAGPDALLNCYQPTLELSGQNAGPGTNLEYQWLDENGNLLIADTSIQISASGMYILSLTNLDNNCSDLDTVQVQSDFSTPMADAGPNQGIDCTASTVTLDGTGSDMGPDLTYQWFDNNGVPLGTNPTQGVNSAGTFSLVLTNTQSGCSDTSTVTVLQDQNAPVANAGPDQTLTCLVQQITLDGSNSSVGPQINYSWLNPSNQVVGSSPVLNVNLPGTYTLLVENMQNNCIDTAMVTVNLDTLPPNFDLGMDTIISCSQPQISLGDPNLPPGQNWQFTWTNMNGTLLGSGANLEVDQANVYNLEILNLDNGCVASDQVVVTANTTPPLADPGPNGLLTCQITDWQLDASNSMGIGGLSFEWQDVLGNFISDQPVLTTSTAGPFTLIVIDDFSGCQDTASVLISTDTIAPLVEAGPNDILNCLQPDLLLQGQTDAGNFAATWIDEQANTLANNLDLMVTQSGQYFLLIEDLDNGCTSQDSLLIDASFDSPTADAGADAVLDCNAQNVTLDGQSSTQGPNFTLNWFNENGILVGNTPTIQVSSADHYTLTVINQINGCQATDTVSVTQDANAPLADAGLNDTLTCNNITLTLDGSNSSNGPEFEVDWMNAQGTSLGQTYQLAVNLPGVYTLTVLNTNNGCISTSNVEVLQDTITPSIDLGMAQTINCFTPSFQLGGPGTSTGPIFSYTWTDTAGNLLGNSPQLVVNAGGTYQLAVSNADNGCSNANSITIPEDLTAPLSDAGPDLGIDCSNPTDVLDGSNSTQGPNLSFTWQDLNGQVLGMGPNLPVSSNGTFILSIFNETNGCSDQDTALVQADFALPTAEAGANQLLNCFAPSTTLDGSNSSNGANFAFNWTDATAQLLGNSPTLSVSVAGTYFLEVLNTDNGCSTLDSVLVNADFLAPNAEAGNPLTLNCFQPAQTLSGVGSSVGPAFSYGWTDQGGQNISSDLLANINQAGTYFFAVLNQQNGCSSQDSVVVNEDFATPTAEAGMTLTLNCLQNSVTLDGSNSSVATDITYQWLNSNLQLISSNISTSVQAAGTYFLDVLNTTNGCESIDSVIVNADFDFPIADAGADALLNCYNPNSTLEIGNSSTGPAFTLSWLDENGQVLSTQASFPINTAGTYQLAIFNTQNGCESLDTVVVEEDFEAPDAVAGMDETLNCLQPNLQLNAVGSSVGPIFSGSWLDASGMVLGNAPTLDITTEGWYFYEVLNLDNGCSNLDSVLISADFEEPQADAGSDDLLTCEEPSATLDGSNSSSGPTFSYQWQDSNGLILSTASIFSTTASGTYILTVLNQGNGCIAVDTALVEVDQDLPTAVLTADDPLTCLVTELLLDPQGSSTGPNIQYEWTSPSGGTIQITPDGTFVTQPGNYELEVINTDNGCSASAGIQILQDIEPPIADAGPALYLNCFQETGTLDGTASTPLSLLTYQWSDPGGQVFSNSGKPLVVAPGLYQLLVTRLDNGCVDSTTVEVNASFLESLTVRANDPTCFEDAGTLLMDSVQGGQAPYLYSVDGGETFSSQLSFSNLSPGSYQVVVQDADGCTFETTAAITAPEELTLFVEPQIDILLGEAYQLFLQTNIQEAAIESILWTPTTALSCSDCLDPIADPLETTLYQIELIDTSGCRTLASTLLRVDERNKVYIPSGFSPDGDGDNDVFMIYAAQEQIQTVRSFLVFNRWGEQVFSYYNFQPNNPAFGWDGTFRGKTLDPAVFVYLAEVEMIDGRVELFKGNVTLVK